MKAASSLVRNDTAPTRSSGTSTRLIACICATASNSSSMVLKPGRGARTKVPGERVSPGAIAFTVIPSEARSVASAREPDDAAFASNIMRETGDHRPERTGGHVHHASPLARAHARYESRCHEKRAVEINRKHLAPVRIGHVGKILLRKYAGA